MRQEMLSVFTFDELTPEVQEKVLNKHRDWNVQFHDWADYIIEDWKDRLDEIGFEDAEIFYSGFWSQGDGACFETKHFNFKKLINHMYENEKKYRHLLKIVDYLSGTIQRNSFGHHYSHEATRYVELDLNNYRSTPRLERLVNELEEELEDLRRSLSKEVYSDLEKEYEYQTSDECLKEIFHCNEMEFFEDGTVFDTFSL